MRRHAGCDERDGGLVDGRQGHDPGSTIGADGLRPLYKSPAVIRMTRSLRGRILLTAGLPFGGRQAGVFPGSGLCGVGQSSHTGCHKQNVQGHPVCLVHGDVASDMSVNALRRAAARGDTWWGRRSKCSAVGADDNGAVRWGEERGVVGGVGISVTIRFAVVRQHPGSVQRRHSTGLRGVFLKWSSV